MSISDAGVLSIQTRHASTCRFAVPTIFADAPAWFDAEREPWTCMRNPKPRVIEDTAECETCPHWQPRETSVLPPD